MPVIFYKKYKPCEVNVEDGSIILTIDKFNIFDFVEPMETIKNDSQIDAAFDDVLASMEEETKKLPYKKGDIIELTTSVSLQTNRSGLCILEIKDYENYKLRLLGNSIIHVGNDEKVIDCVCIVQDTPKKYMTEGDSILSVSFIETSKVAVTVKEV